MFASFFCSLKPFDNIINSLRVRTTTSGIPLIAIYIVAFVRYTNIQYGIHSFWIDRESTDSVYGSILAVYCNEHSYPKTEVKVFVPCEDEETESITSQYCPPFHSIVHVASNDGTREAVYKDIIEHSTFCLTDFTGEQYPMIRELCRKYEKAELIDISARNFQVDTSFTDGNNT